MQGSLATLSGLCQSTLALGQGFALQSFTSCGPQIHLALMGKRHGTISIASVHCEAFIMWQAYWTLDVEEWQNGWKAWPWDSNRIQSISGIVA